MFACTQTTVCVQANSCLTIGKHRKTASIVPQRMPLAPSKDATCSLNGCHLFPRCILNCTPAVQEEFGVMGFCRKRPDWREAQIVLKM